jgi:anti-sigma28 factor (negative regulator of flagellin synthesis)
LRIRNQTTWKETFRYGRKFDKKDTNIWKQHRWNDIAAGSQRIGALKEYIKKGKISSSKYRLAQKLVN